MRNARVALACTLAFLAGFSLRSDPISAERLHGTMLVTQLAVNSGRNVLQHPGYTKKAPIEQADADVAAAYKGAWSTSATTCVDDPAEGPLVLRIDDLELSFYEIACDIQKVQATTLGIKLDIRCVKGAGATGSGYVNLQRRGDRKLDAYFSPLGDFAQGFSETFYSCGETGIEFSPATHWKHNGSVMSLVVEGRIRKLFYQSPRAGIWEVGVRPGTLLFEGETHGHSYRGTAYVFNRVCGATPYEVAGPIVDGGRRVVMSGHAPRVGNDCKIIGHRADTMVFELID